MKSQSNLVVYLYINCLSMEAKVARIYLHFHFEGFENERLVSSAFWGLFFRIDRKDSYRSLNVTRVSILTSTPIHHYNSISITLCCKLKFFLPFKYLNAFCCLAAVQCSSLGSDKYWNNKKVPCSLFQPLGCNSLQQIWPFNLIWITFHCIDPPAPTAFLTSGSVVDALFASRASLPS